MSADRDQAWLDLLAGRDVPGADPELAREAALLRDGLRRYRPEVPAGDLPAPDERIRRLLARAREAGIVPGVADLPAPAPARGMAIAARRWWPAALLGLGLTAGVSVWWSHRPGSAPETTPFVMRGEGVLQRPAADLGQARAQRDALLARLRALGFEVDAYEQLDRPGVDLVLVPALSAAQQAGLAELGIPSGSRQHLRIEFVPAAR